MLISFFGFDIKELRNGMQDVALMTIALEKILDNKNEGLGDATDYCGHVDET